MLNSSRKSPRVAITKHHDIERIAIELMPSESQIPIASQGATKRFATRLALFYATLFGLVGTQLRRRRKSQAAALASEAPETRRRKYWAAALLLEIFALLFASSRAAFIGLAAGFPMLVNTLAGLAALGLSAATAGPAWATARPQQA